MVEKVEDGWWSVSSGIRSKSKNRFAFAEEERLLHRTQPWAKVSGGKEQGYWVLHCNVIANGHDVAYMRMKPTFGQVVEDTVNEGFALFVSECTIPVEFEFYDPSFTLLGRRFWDMPN